MGGFYILSKTLLYFFIDFLVGFLPIFFFCLVMNLYLYWNDFNASGYQHLSNSIVMFPFFRNLIEEYCISNWFILLESSHSSG